MGGAQPLAVVANGGVCLVVDVDEKSILKRQELGCIDEIESNFEVAINKCLLAKENKSPLSVGLIANAADIYPEFWHGSYS